MPPTRPDPRSSDHKNLPKKEDPPIIPDPVPPNPNPNPTPPPPPPTPPTPPPPTPPPPDPVPPDSGDPYLRKGELTAMGELKSEPPKRGMKKHFRNREEEEEYREKFAAFAPNPDEPPQHEGNTLVVINWERRGTDIYCIPCELLNLAKFSPFNNKTVNSPDLNEPERREFSSLLEKFHEVYSDFSVTTPPSDKDQEEYNFHHILVFNRHF